MPPTIDTTSLYQGFSCGLLLSICAGGTGLLVRLAYKLWNEFTK